MTDGFKVETIEKMTTPLESHLSNAGFDGEGIHEKSSTMVRLANVSKIVNSGTQKLTILQPIYLSIPRKQFVAIVGPSGSGKSTFLSLVAGLDYPTTGYIRLDGEYITQMQEGELARLRGERVGFVFQSFHLVPSLTALENILAPIELRGLPNSRDRARKLLNEVGLESRAHHYPSQLSGGEQQRVAIARAFANDPTVLLADEPTGNLDSRNGAHVFELLIKLNREHGTTLLLVTHDHELSSQADRIISLNEGRIVSDVQQAPEAEPAVRSPYREIAEPSKLESVRANLTFTLNMAWREMRSSWYRLALFFLCMAIGVGSMVGLRSLVQNLNWVVQQEVRSFFGADVRAGANKMWTPEALELLEKYSHTPPVTEYTEIIEAQTMARAAADPSGKPYLIQVRAVQDQFPLYGEVKLVGGERYSPAMLDAHGVLIQKGLQDQMNLKRGDDINIGNLRFTVRAVMEFLPANEMQFGPIQRVLMKFADAEAAGLTSFGTRGTRSWLFKTEDGQDGQFLQRIAPELRGKGLTILASFRYQENFMTESLKNVERFLSIVALAIMVLGGIGIASVTRVFVQQKLKSIAILKCLGGDNRQVLGAYLVQVGLLSLVGSLLGLAFAIGITHLVPKYAEGRLPIALVPGLSQSATIEGLIIGTLVTLLFAVPPLMEIRQVKPILVLRQDESARRRLDWMRLLSVFIAGASLLAIIFWQSNSLQQGGVFLGFLLGTAVVLSAAGSALMYLLRQVRRVPAFALRQGISSLYRPGNQTRVILFAVGLAATFTISIQLEQGIVQRELNVEETASGEDLYLIDVQKDQRSAAQEALTRSTGREPLMVPVVQGRIVALKRDPANQRAGSDLYIRNLLNWTQRFSYRPNLREDESIVAGEFWGPSAAEEPEVSLEESFANSFQIGVGDKLTFDILGKPIEATVTSLRRLEHSRSPSVFLTRFYVLFRPGALEDAPQMFVCAAKGPKPGPERAQVQREFVDQFPNVTIVDAFETLAEVRKRMSEVSFAVSMVSGFVFLCGVLILAGSIAMTKYQRLYEAAILKTLGARMKLIVYIALIEYGVLGLLAGLIGSSSATVLTWALSKTGFDIPWHFIPSINLIGVAFTVVLVAVVGVVSSWDVIVKKPLTVLRME